MRAIRYILFMLAVSAFVAGCKKDFDGAEKANQPPETFVVADTIVRQGQDRFTSQVQIQWWGTDADGYVTGYEYSFDEVNWFFTKRQDSVFTLTLPGSSDTFDFKFSVRAIDNKSAKDETPAHIFYPVKNSAPTVGFYVPTGIPSRNPVRSFPALKFLWTADDKDGIISLDSFEIVWNDTTATATKIAPGIREVLLVGTNMAGAITDCDIYLGNSQQPSGRKIGGLRLDDTNRLYIRAIDKTGAKSPFAVSKTVFVKKPKSNILIVNAIESPFLRSNIQSFYATAFANVSAKTYDVLMATEKDGNNFTELSPDPFTQSLVFKFFTRIMWFGDNLEFSLGLLQKSSGPFFANGGRMLVINSANDAIPTDPAYLDFTPIKSFLPVSNNDAFLINQNDSLLPLNAGWPYLSTPDFLTGIRPFELQTDNVDYNYRALYNGKITHEKNSTISLWTGTSTLIAKRIRKGDNKTDFVVAIVPLHSFNRHNNFDSWLDMAVNAELEF